VAVGVCRWTLANQRRGQARRSAATGRLHARIGSLDVPDAAAGVAEAQVMRQAMERLTDDDREVLRLTAWEGLSSAKVGLVIGTSAITARGRLHRARARLKEFLREIEQDSKHFSSNGHDVSAGKGPPGSEAGT
jgi:RNA polymerase sigma factor (sigma-70 family)